LSIATDISRYSKPRPVDITTPRPSKTTTQPSFFFGGEHGYTDYPALAARLAD